MMATLRGLLSSSSRAFLRQLRGGHRHVEFHDARRGLDVREAAVDRRRSLRVASLAVDRQVGSSGTRTRQAWRMHCIRRR